ncbi:helix-turn-helix domain-containing protein [Acidithiobacillus sp. M4-SHS-6]
MKENASARVLTRMRKAGLIEMQGRTIQVPDLQALERWAAAR